MKEHVEAQVSSHRGDVQRTRCPRCNQGEKRRHVVHGSDVGKIANVALDQGLERGGEPGVSAASLLPFARLGQAARQCPRQPGIDTFGCPRDGWRLRAEQQVDQVRLRSLDLGLGDGPERHSLHPSDQSVGDARQGEHPRRSGEQELTRTRVLVDDPLHLEQQLGRTLDHSRHFDKSVSY